MKISDNGKKFTKLNEGVRLKAYQDGGGVWTIGYGHTRGVTSGMTCTQAQADAWFDEDINSSENDVNKLVRVSLTQNQFDVLVDFAFQFGYYKLKESTLLKRINEKDFADAGQQLLRWNQINGKVDPGLVKRCERRKALFES